MSVVMIENLSRLKTLCVLQETEESISESTESGEAPTAATTGIPVSIVVPTFPVYTDSGRGDNMGYSDYKKSIVYEQSNIVEKEPSPYKSYPDDKMGLNLVSKKSGATFDDGAANDVEKTLKVYKVYTVLLPLHGSRLSASSASALPVSKLSPVSKPTALSRPKALQVHEEILEEDTSTPEVDSQGLDTSSGAQEEAGSPKQAVGSPDEAALDSSSSAASEGPASQSESQSQSEEEAAAAAEGASASSGDSNGTSESASASQEEDESESSQSSEESATATPGAADSDESEDSEESNSSSEEQGPEPTSEAPILVITAK